MSTVSFRSSGRTGLINGGDVVLGSFEGDKLIYCYFENAVSFWHPAR